MSVVADFMGTYVGATDASNLPNTDLAGHTTFVVYAGFDEPEDSLLGIVDANISVFGGSLFQNNLAGDLPPVELLITAIPNIAPDSFVTIGALTQPFDPGSVNLTPDFNSNAFNTDNQIIGGWFAAPDDATGASLGDAGLNMFDDNLGVWLVPIMQLTVADGGGTEIPISAYEQNGPLALELGLDGTATLGWSDPVDGAEPILVNETLMFIPTPSAIAMLGIAACAGRRRRSEN